MHCATALLPYIDMTCILLDYLLCMKIISLLVVIATAIAIFLRQFCPRGKKVQWGYPMLQTVQKTYVNVSMSADGNTICIIKTLCSMHCLSSITFTEFLSKSLLCLYLSYKKDCSLRDIEHWIHCHKCLGFGPEPHPLTFSAFHSGMRSLCHTTLQFDLSSVWLMESKISSASGKIPAF